MSQPDDHRPRVAAERRDRMRRHLLESAWRAVQSHGSAALPLEALLAEAQVSRATFYKYFADVPAVVRAMAVEVSDELIAALDPLVKAHDDPAARLACGLLGSLRAVQARPALGLLLAGAGWPAVDLGPQHALHRLVGADLERGMKKRRFVRMDLSLALDLMQAAAIAAAHRLAMPDVPPDLVPQAVSAALRQLGLPADEAQALARLPLDLPTPPPGSWLGQAAVAAGTATRGRVR